VADRLVGGTGVVFRNHPEFHVVASTATQIPDIAGRRNPPVLAGRGYPDGIPIVEENDLEKVIKHEGVDVASHPHRPSPGNHARRDRLGPGPHPQSPRLVPTKLSCRRVPHPWF
jgi:hypothetical protein